MWKVSAALIAALPLLAQNPPVPIAQSALQTQVVIANAASTGTTLNTLTKLTGAPSTAVIAATTDTNGVLGITIGGAGTGGNATIQTSGFVLCIFDGATTAGDYVQISSSTNGDCTDGGSTLPSSGQVLGRVLSTHGGSGTYQIDLTGGGGGGGTVTSITAGNCITLSPSPITTTGSVASTCGVGTASFSATTGAVTLTLSGGNIFSAAMTPTGNITGITMAGVPSGTSHLAIQWTMGATPFTASVAPTGFNAWVGPVQVANAITTAFYETADGGTTWNLIGASSNLGYTACPTSSTPGANPASGTVYGWCTTAGHQSLNSSGSQFGEVLSGAGINLGTGQLTSTAAGTTQTAFDNSTLVATDAYVDSQNLIITSGLTAGHAYYVSAANTLAEAGGGISATTPAVCVAVNTTQCLERGHFTTTGLTAGAVYYVPTTAAVVTSTEPSGTGQFVQRVGVALSTTILLVGPSRDVGTIQ